MATRFNANSQSRFGVAGLPSGYGVDSSPVDLSIPAVGIEDVDSSLFKLFDKEIEFTVSSNQETSTGNSRVPVIFASGEKWALQKRTRALRDRNNTLILPLITVVRTSIEQSGPNDITGRGINQQTGEIHIQRRLDKSDRQYQRLINRLLIPNQEGLVEPTNDGSVSPGRELGDLAQDPVVRSGGLLLADRQRNVYETIVVPSPQFYTATYEVTFWTQYTVQMVQLLEQLISSFLPQGQSWRLETPKGYWFMAHVDENVYTAETNVDDMSNEERIIKHKFTVKVLGYILASRVPGAPVPIKRYVSVPTVSFDVGVDPTLADDSLGEGEPAFLGADDPTLPLTGERPRRRDARDDGSTRLYPGPGVDNPDDPAIKALGRAAPARYRKITGVDARGNRTESYARVVTTNRFTGETVMSATPDLGGLSIIATEDMP